MIYSQRTPSIPSPPLLGMENREEPSRLCRYCGVGHGCVHGWLLLTHTLLVHSPRACALVDNRRQQKRSHCNATPISPICILLPPDRGSVRKSDFVLSCSVGPQRIGSSQCPLWVISGHVRCTRRCLFSADSGHSQMREELGGRVGNATITRCPL